jgi:four helix bundle protein
MGTPATRFENLVVWRKAHPFVLKDYRLTRAFPRSEIYGRSTQFRRAAVSIAASIAEDFRKCGKADKLLNFNIAQGPIEESLYYLFQAEDLQYGDFDELGRLLEEVSKRIVAYSRFILNSDS